MSSSFINLKGVLLPDLSLNAQTQLDWPYLNWRRHLDSLLGVTIPSQVPLQILRQNLGFGGNPTTAFPKITVHETEAEVRLDAFVPGLDPGAIEINLEGSELTISGIRKDSWESEKGSQRESKSICHRKEIFTGNFSRTVLLPEDVEPSTSEARYEAGILTIHLNKRAKTQPKKIEIKVN